MITFQRPDYREANELRSISFIPQFAPHAQGSVLVKFDNTQVICAATLEKKVPKWMLQQGVEGGWITAEYSMLPYSTLERKQRDSTKGSIDGRNIEIQRLIGRALRAVVDLKKLPGYTMWIDCDVLQADGGTRTASITGAYVAAQMAIKKLIAESKLEKSPFIDSVAAVSVGIFENTPILDLNFEEDKNAEVDFNVIMTGTGKFVEVQGAGEETTFTQEQLDELLSLAKNGLQTIHKLQEHALNT